MFSEQGLFKCALLEQVKEYTYRRNDPFSSQRCGQGRGCLKYINTRQLCARAGIDFCAQGAAYTLIAVWAEGFSLLQAGGYWFSPHNNQLLY